MSLGGSTTGRSVNLELGRSATACIQMNETDVRTLAGRASGAICMQDFYGKSSIPTPTTFGTFDAAWGGYYIGTLCSYFLFVAPNATGCACCQWKTTGTSTSGTASVFDGFANTYPALNNATHPAGNFTATRTINGFSDWYLPAKDELNQLYINDGGTTNTNLPSGEGFAARNYWSSTEYSAAGAGACFQSFVYGSINASFKTSSNRVRAVRRIPI
jgi:hypothetical protein